MVGCVVVLDFIEEAASSPCLGKERFDLDSIHVDKGLRDEVFCLVKLDAVKAVFVYDYCDLCSS